MAKRRINYEILRDQTMKHNGRILYRVRRLSDGLIGGWIEGEHNLSPHGTCFVFDEAKVYDDAVVRDHAKVRGRAIVRDGARVEDFAIVRDDARILGDSVVCDDAVVCDSEIVDCARVDGRYYGVA